jgi:hypothetical protein
MKKYITILTTGTILMYLMMAFTKWEFNPGMWGEDIRVIFDIMFIGWSVMAGMLAQMLND